MPVLDLFSKRRKRAEKKGRADVYVYDTLPVPFRVQVVHIMRDAIGVGGQYGHPDINGAWQFIHDSVAREKGVFELSGDGSPDGSCIQWLVHKANTDDALDMIELAFRVIERHFNNYDSYTRTRQSFAHYLKSRVIVDWVPDGFADLSPAGSLDLSDSY